RRGAAALGAMAVALAVTPFTPGLSQPGPGQPGSGPLWPSTVPVLAVPASASPGPATAGQVGKGPGWREIILPDLAVIEPPGLSLADVARLGKLRGLSKVLAVDGATIGVRGHRVNVIGVDAQRFRSWTPLATASSQRLWAALARGEFASS